MVAQKKSQNALQAVLDRQVTTKTNDPETKQIASSSPLKTNVNTKTTSNELDKNTSLYSRPSRTGTRLIGGHFPPDVAKNLKILAAEEDTSIQLLLEEALDLLFVKKGRNSIRR